MTTTQEQNRNQQIIATSRKASEISSWEPTVILCSLLESLMSISLLLVKVKATFKFPFTCLLFVLTLSAWVSSYSSERVQMRHFKKLVLSLPLGFNAKKLCQVVHLFYKFMTGLGWVWGAPEQGTSCSPEAMAFVSRRHSCHCPPFLGSMYKRQGKQSEVRGLLSLYLFQFTLKRNIRVKSLWEHYFQFSTRYHLCDTGCFNMVLIKGNTRRIWILFKLHFLLCWGI